MTDNITTEEVHFRNIEEGDRILWENRTKPLDVTNVRRVSRTKRVTAISTRETEYELIHNTRGYNNSEKAAYYHRDNSKHYVDNFRRVVEE